jgi:hypothetical protein
MSDDPKKYLATEVLSERRTVSYRTVSRALRVHVNAAKCLLWEFYEFQNGKTPGSVHATYLLSGVKKQQTQADTDGTKHKYDEDEPIPSSPPPFTSSMLEPGQHEAEEETAIPVRTITLVRDDSLEGVYRKPAEDRFEITWESSRQRTIPVHLLHPCLQSVGRAGPRPGHPHGNRPRPFCRRLCETGPSSTQQDLRRDPNPRRPPEKGEAADRPPRAGAKVPGGQRRTEPIAT